MGNLKSRRCLIEAIESRLLLNGTIYVDANATGDAHDGTSWPSAYVDLQQALAVAVAGDEIHVAAGVYKPTSTNDRNILFRLNNGVALLGGYAGDQAANPNERDLKIHPTILSGDIGIAGQSSDNSKTILANTLSDSSTVCDGFTLTGASGGTAAMTISKASPTVNNCTFQQNLQSGLSCGLSSSPAISQCTFLQNSSSIGGGIRITGTSSPIIEGCQFVNNSVTTSSGFGGGLYCSTSTPVIKHCTFQSNSAAAGGGGMYQISSSAIVTDCQFTSNIAVSGGGVYNSASTGTFTRCTFTGNTASGTSYMNGGGGIGDFSKSSSKICNALLQIITR